MVMRLPDILDRANPVFTFIGCIELREILGRRARDERELMEALEQIPAASVYYHTHSIFLRHPRIAGAYPNDFANWVATQVRDRRLAERLAVVDPYQFAGVEELREELVSIVDSHIASLHPVPRVVFGDPFFFVQSHALEVATGLEARTLEDFRRGLAQVDLSAVYLHTLHARVRGAVAGGDFAQWIGQTLGLEPLAAAIGRINPYLGGLEEMRQETLRLIDAQLDGGLQDHVH
jgi:hypothetical protein